MNFPVLCIKSNPSKAKFFIYSDLQYADVILVTIYGNNFQRLRCLNLSTVQGVIMLYKHIHFIKQKHIKVAIATQIKMSVTQYI